jgi:hypothetical protein
MINDNTQIAGWKTADDWRALRSTLIIGGSPDRWTQAFDQFFRTRLDLRYLNPVRVLQDHGTFQGEGFSILAIQCTLVEFLESTVQGIKYRYPQIGESLGTYEYSSSGNVFISFLCKRQPFANDFDERLAGDSMPV